MLPRWAARSKQMLTFEDVTGYFLKAAASLDLVTHPEYWVNSRSLEREFACTCHTGSCEEGETRSSCTLSFRSEEHTSELQSHSDLVCRLLLEKKKTHQG